MPAITGETTRPCPQCGVEMRVDDRFTVWCAACDWNVDPEGQGPDAGRLERAARALARRHGEHPPTHLRRACLLAGTPEAAAVVPQAHRTERIAAELAEARTEMARRLLRDGLDD
ncbi:hypothetical protein [Streptomyces scabiei]|uniref:Uncharacterized protein n=1 Tax=Streptomyces scabiei TaxID=1930 RepID=A0A100JWF6_STRSC|nr:hypothetical protein [Streptomyces scabiei]GAQ66929.1 hypothetical protein SsS58_07369 [Streptomyces scabiei]